MHRHSRRQPSGNLRLPGPGASGPAGETLVHTSLPARRELFRLLGRLRVVEEGHLFFFGGGWEAEGGQVQQIFT